MTTRKSVWVLFGILVISGWVLGSVSYARAETMHLKFYTWVTKAQEVPIDDVEGHVVRFVERGVFYVFENGEVATSKNIATADLIKGSGTYTEYVTMTFQDGSTMVRKNQGTVGEALTGGSGGIKSEIIKGTGRFEGAKGTASGTIKYLPLEKGEAGPKGYGEGTMTYTLPSK